MCEAGVIMDPLRATISLIYVRRFHSYLTVNISSRGYNKTADDVLRDVAPRLERGILSFRNIIPCYVADGGEKSVAFTVIASAFTKPSDSRQHHVHMSE
jgi:hypothetical protein